MTNLFAALKLVSYVLSGLYGVYYVSGLATETVILKTEKRQFAKHKKYNDSLETSRNLHAEEMAKRYEPNFTLEEQAEVTERIVNDGIKSLKRYVNNENRKQEEIAKEQFQVVYFMDENDSTYKLLTYKGSDGKNIVVRQIPISTNEFNSINN